MYPSQVRCSCGWKNTAARNAAPASVGFCDYPGCSNPGTLSRSIGEGGWHCTFHFFGKGHKPVPHKNLTAIASRHKQEEVDNFVRSRRGTSKREACLSYLRGKGLFSLIPKSLVDDEARVERESIQNEGTP